MQCVRVITFFMLASMASGVSAVKEIAKETVKESQKETKPVVHVPETKKDKPIVVVICSYNNSKWTKDTLDSVFSQDYSNFRLIIVDDCSSDGNQEVIQQY